MVLNDDERIALFLDYENLAIGARDGLGVAPFDFAPIADALAERGRVVTRRAYADWSYFDEDRRLLARAQVELIEIPQRLGASRKNAADIKMAVDAIQLAYERGFITTFAICTGDSDFTPLVHKLRELDKRVIGIGVQSSTSALLPPACDEFLFYDRLPGVEPAPARRGPRPGAAPAAAPVAAGRAAGRAAAAASRRPPHPRRRLGALVARTLAGLQRHADGPVLASRVKRAILRKDPTFDEADHGFRGFGELLRHLESQRIVELRAGQRAGRPGGQLPAGRGGRGRGLPAARRRRRSAAGRRGAAAAERAEEPAAQAGTGVQREALRLQQLPVLHQGRAGPRPDRHGLGRGHRRLPAAGSGRGPMSAS